MGNDRLPVFVQVNHSQMTDVRTMHQSWECGVTIVTRSLIFVYAEIRKHLGKKSVVNKTVFYFLLKILF